MPRPTPRYNWRLRPEGESLPFSEDDFSEIVGTIGSLLPADAGLRESFRASLQDIGAWYKLARHQHGMPTNRQVEEALWQLHRNANALVSLISRLDDVSIEALFQQKGLVRDSGREMEESPFDAERVRHGFRPIAQIAEEASAAARWVEDRSHHPDEVFDPKLLGFVKTPFQENRVPTYKLIKELAQLYEEATGRETSAGHDRATESYSGPFFQFVSKVFEKLGNSRQPSGLGRTIDDALTERRQFLETLEREG